MQITNPFNISTNFKQIVSRNSEISENYPAYWFIFQAGKIALINEPQSVHIPQSTNNNNPLGIPAESHCIGQLGSSYCFALELDDHVELPLNYELFTLRSLIHLISDNLFAIAGRAQQILHFHATHAFCGRCGTQTTPSNEEVARACPQCNLVTYPRLSPVVIVLVTKKDRILLARSPRFPNGMFSALAGFVEPGETAEDAVFREVKEEVGIEVVNPRYMGSQPWPFPHSFMLGFTAEHENGELLIDQDEIESADWFRPEDLPQIPPVGTIARLLIDSFIKDENVT